MPTKRKTNKRKNGPLNRSRRTRRSRGPLGIRAAPAFAPTTPFSSSTMSNSVGLNVYSPKSLNYRYKMDYGSAPPHELAGGVAGLRLHVTTSKHYLMRSTSAARYIFSDGTNYFQFLSMNPLMDAAASHTYSPILGAGSPAAKIVSMFTRYSVRHCSMRYEPSRGYQETGTYGLVFRPDVETTLDSFAEIKNTDGFKDFAINKSTNKVFISSDIRKPASTLYFVDETQITDKDRTRQGYIHGASQDLQSTADMLVGDLVFTMVIDCYVLQGDPNPALSTYQSLRNTVSDPDLASKYAEFLMTLNPIRPFKIASLLTNSDKCIVSASTSSASTSSATSCSSGSKRDSFLLVNPSRKMG